MTASDLAIKQQDRTPESGLHFNEFSRAMIAVSQMAADACILPISSLLSLGFAIVTRHHEDIYFYLYVLPTVAATVVLVLSLARSGVYDVFNTISRLGVLGSTIRRVL